MNCIRVLSKVAILIVRRIDNKGIFTFCVWVTSRLQNYSSEPECIHLEWIVIHCGWHEAECLSHVILTDMCIRIICIPIANIFFKASISLHFKWKTNLKNLCRLLEFVRNCDKKKKEMTFLFLMGYMCPIISICHASRLCVVTLSA